MTAVVTLGGFGCAADNSAEPEEPGTKQQPIIYDQLGLGEGFDTRQNTADPSYSGTGASCVLDPETKFTRQPKLEFRISSFHSSTESTARIQLQANVEADFTFEEYGLTAGIDNGFGYLRESSTSEEMLVFGVEATTATEGFAFKNFPDDGSLCEQEELTIEQFLDNCGTKYHSSRDLGGFLLYMLNVESLTEEEKAELQRGESIGVVGQKIDLGAQLDFLETNVRESLDIFVWSRGFANPPVANDEGDMTTVSDLLAWSSSLDMDSGEAVVKQEFENYSSGVVSACGINAEIESQLRCSWELFDERDDVYTNAAFERRLEFLIGAVANQQNFRFDGITPEDTESLIDDVENCRGALDNAVQTCQAAINQGAIESLCEVCQTPQTEELNCSFEALESRMITQLELIERTPPADPIYPTGSCGAAVCQEVQHHVYDASTSNATTLLDRTHQFCTFGGMVGKFAGGGELVQIVPSGTDDWAVTVQSGRDAKNEEVKAFVNCSNRANFFWNAPGNPVFPDPVSTGLVATATQNAPATSEPFYLTALSGLTGRMEGGGEYGLVNSSAWPPLITAATQQAGLQAWFTSFGPLNSAGQEPEEATLNFEKTWSWDTTASDGAHQADIKLPNAGTSHCFLTRLGGDFDGHAEYARLVVDPSDNHWRLRVRSSDAPKQVKVTARCIAYNQTEPAPPTP